MHNATSFPGSLLFTPQEAREGRPWLGLVTCLPKSGRLQISDWREGRLCQFAHTKCTEDGKTCPSENQLAESCVFERSCQVVIWQKPLKKVYKASKSMNVGCCRFVNRLEILEILEKSLQQSRNRLLLAEAEELLYGDELPLATSTL